MDLIIAFFVGGVIGYILGWIVGYSSEKKISLIVYEDTEQFEEIIKSVFDEILKQKRVQNDRNKLKKQEDSD